MISAARSRSLPENQLELAEQRLDPLRIEPLSLPIEEDGVLELAGLAGEVRDLLVHQGALWLELEGRAQLDGRLLELLLLAVGLGPGHVLLEALLLGGTSDGRGGKQDDQGSSGIGEGATLGPPESVNAIA